MKTWKARVTINKQGREIQVQAKSHSDAKAIIESQHGKGCIQSGPTEVR